MNQTTLDKVLHFTRGKMRVVLSWLALYFLIVNIKQFPSYLGITVLFLGALLRFISSGYIDKEGKLSVGGPYQFVRNPLYLGSILIAVGAALAQSNWILTAAFFVGSILMHLPIIWAEERVLSVKFGADYQTFKNTVPRLIPWKFWGGSALLNNPNINIPKFSWSRCMHNKAYEAFLVFLAILVLEIAVWKVKEIQQPTYTGEATSSGAH